MFSLVEIYLWSLRFQVFQRSILLKSRLLAARFVRCDWKFDGFLFKCVCCFYADVTIYDFWNTQRSITVTQEGTRVVKHSGRAYRQGTRTCQSLIRMMISAIVGREVWFGQYFRRYREFMSLKFRMLLLCYRYVIVYAYYTHIMILQRSNVTWFYDSHSLLYFSKYVVLR